ncbi:POT family protein [Microdochium trichocladiopsis]|uniref:POT family protein n=1 Tax=Microdochium trichocladiopsis TaxID=1682393 RepID=A0A9P8XUF9_9PEZI|nr:POT family protein [Microdochium trichocladiopsis]KAH7018308.1 POT family protein [Microdochium trichocladiopsis]
MSTGANLDTIEAARANAVDLDNGAHGASGMAKSDVQPSLDNDRKSSKSLSGDDTTVLRGPNGEEYPTAEELLTLERVPGPITWIIYTIAFIELCERFAYYGTTAVFVNFISQPLPPGSTTGAGMTIEQAGALGFGQQASTGLTLFNSFWAYLMPLFGGYFADSYWGKYKTIHIAIVVAMFGHIILIVSALPPVIANPSGALGCFSVGLIFFGIGVGFFKANISPMIAEQYEAQQPRAVIKTLNDGRRVIVDPVLTISVIYMRYYWFINVGALTGQISMVYAENYVGFWLSFTLPTALFIICPMVLIAFKSKYVRTPPTGSVLGKASGLFFLALKKSRGRIRSGHGFWDAVKPSNIPEAERPEWMTFDDVWVEEVRRGFKACLVFVWLPVWWLAYNQVYNNLISQAATMRLDGVPNDIITNLNPLALLIFIPICDKFVYPALRKMGFKLTPIKKMTAGFFLGSLSMLVSAIIQHYIYMLSPCRETDGYGFVDGCDNPPNLSVWVQTPVYVLVAFSEIAASITGLEYAFTKAPKNMRGMVTSIFWFSQAFSAALSQAFVGLSTDPLLVWLYTAIAAIAFVGGIGFWFTFRALDKEEEQLNALPDSVFQGSRNKDVDIAAVEAAQHEQQKLRHAQGLDKHGDKA